MDYKEKGQNREKIGGIGRKARRTERKKVEQ